MASLTVRRLDDDVKAALRMRAAAAGRSLEAEARLILTAAAQRSGARPSESLSDLVERLFPKDLRLEDGLDCSGADQGPAIAPDLS